jgi:hypothetical protein
MAEILLLNPKGRKMAKRRTAAQKRATAKLVALNRARRGGVRRVARKATATKRRTARRANPVAMANPAPRRRRRSARRANPAAAVRRRRRNPINLGGRAGGIMGPIKEAAIQGAGAVAFDIGYGYVSPYLPASMAVVPGRVGVGNAVKALITVVAGQFLSKYTKGLSRKAAVGALTIQARDIVASMLPASTASVAGLGYAVPGRVINMNTRVNPNRTMLNAYQRAGQTPLLSAYTQPGQTPLLNGALEREGVRFR